MIDIAAELKSIYKSDLLPLVSELALKELEIYFPSLSLTIKTDQIVDDTFELNESLCSSSDLTLGACEASVIKFRVANVSQDLTGLEFSIIQRVNGTYTMPFGSYTVLSCEKQDDLIFKEIVAYDSMKKTDVDVVTWYNGLTFPITVKAMRESLLTYLGLQYEDQTLINDSVELTKTINPTTLLGRDVLKRLCQLNGGFGHFTRLNKFKVVQLSSLGLYPSETLYPAEDLFPAESGELLTAGYKSINYEEYIVEPITKLQISQSDGDEGVVVGTGTNTYVITENFLLYGKTAEELTTIANNILLQVKNKYYRPHETVMVGLPYLEVGDTLSIITGTDAIETFIFTRSLKGIQALEDTVTASGSRTRTNKVGLNTQVEQLKGRTLKLIKTIDELSSTITDLEDDVSSAFTQMASSIELKVSKSGVIAAINVSPESVSIKANKINFNGYAQFDANGGITSINGAVLQTGTVVADTIRAGYVYAGTINANQIDGGTIQGVVFTSTGASYSTTISGGQILSNYIHMASGSVWTSIYPNGIMFNDGSQYTSIGASGITTPTLNNGIPLTSNSTIYTNSITASNTGYGNIDLLGFDNACGVNYAQSTFQPLGASDIRLKHNIQPLDGIPDELFYELKPYQFEYKTETYGNGIFFGFIAQEVESAFNRHGLNPYNYNLIELKDVRAYTDDGYYVNDATHRIHYNNLIAWAINIIQKQEKRITQLESIII